jgi:hypothetical protein
MNDLELLANSAQRINHIKISGIMTEYSHTYRTQHGELFTFSLWVPRKKSKFLLNCVIFDTKKAQKAASELQKDQILLVEGEFDISSYKKDDAFVSKPQVIVKSYAQFSSETLLKDLPPVEHKEKEPDPNLDMIYDDGGVPF